MQEKIEEMHKNMTHIQNTIWNIYKDFLESHDMGEYNQKMSCLVQEYQYKGDELFFSFCKSQFVLWEWYIRTLGAEFRKEKKG